MSCLFCSIAAGEIASKQVYSDDAAVAFLDINPWHPGHTLVVPRRHTDDATSEPRLLAEIAPAVANVAQLLKDKLGADAVNLLVNSGAAAGQEVFHLHVHVVPRRADLPGVANLANREPGIDLDEVYARITS
ncbi:MAG: HIT family protein [Propionibacteriaceae bacterium]|nr:HIT family protein [Propionibacteriaceae bacterium]